MYIVAGKLDIYFTPLFLHFKTFNVQCELAFFNYMWDTKHTHNIKWVS